MILLYHKVADRIQTEWWVSTDTFERHLVILADYEVVYLDDYDPDDPRHVVLSFDDGYACTVEFALPLLRRYGYPFEMFAIGSFAGHLNSFDPDEPETAISSLAELQALVDAGGRVQWHTRTHPHLRGMSPEAQASELAVPHEWRSRLPDPHLRWLAYPYGEHDATTVGIARDRFDGAVSVHQGVPHDSYRWNRLLVFEDTDLKAAGHLGVHEPPPLGL